LTGIYVKRLNYIYPYLFPESELAQHIMIPKGPDTKQHIFGPTASDFKQLKTLLFPPAWFQSRKHLELNTIVYLVPRTFNIRE